MTRRRSRPRVAVEITQDATGALTASWVPDVPRPPLPMDQWPIRCLLGRHRPMGVYDVAPAGDDHLLEPGIAWPAGEWVTRCTRCGKRVP